ncbi:ADP-ribosylglycohydrolase [Megasphaera cerevisiae DSM 20462]|jgi:ADP-ribosylglycohydrolase|uniref:ADP-ribosylglycohydrolase n=1 Tax=Megasphaera cerevisiae DSM 20462 TaxID=1122219 RepID=A0A0J6WSY7_9FIRM|nr:ADP-ribosylglycohydrolase family protein [Megasphaera cerevisiae]KMO85604.1 ADP-ribosylglycohydrolase [Megasphaera cerevisiae DSM 20462]OKY52651.1 ADP-ribosylglycohydrolase [Megasphaera cerevisiae]SKA12580.1 ADP-ribosylglycohydrolase [Megasphaera cerevisiae DSM 20462]
MNAAERFTGCMLGGATGDALGYLIEFDDLKTIRKKYGPYGLRTVLKLEANGKKGVISDDTQMSLFTADGLLWADHDGITPQEGLYRSYMRWYYTQTERIVKPEQMSWMKAQEHEQEWGYDLMNDETLFVRRAPGRTCLIALALGKCFDKEHKANNSKGSSTVMRAAPIGLFYSGDPEKAFAVGCQSGWLTHGNPAAYLAAGTLSAIISFLTQGRELNTALAGSLAILQKQENNTGLLKGILRAIDEAVTDRNPVHSMKKIGQGWAADEAMAMAIYCVLKSETLKDAVIMACNQDGDSDTCGAVCGNITGALYGAAAIPKNWLSNLECLDLLKKMAGCMYERSLHTTEDDSLAEM